jgi:hypothetical protein
MRNTLRKPTGETEASEQIMRKPQNFLKHSDKDPSVTFDFDTIKTESLAFFVVMNLGLICSLSTEESVLQLWYLACHSATLDPTIEPYNKILEIFGDLRDTTRTLRLAEGKRFLAEQLAIANSSIPRIHPTASC